MLNVGLRDLAVLCLCLAVGYRYRQRKPLPFPPGPTRWPVIGNALVVPLTLAHKAYKDMGAKLGTRMIYLEALGMQMLVINNLSVAQELLEKRSTVYSSRPPLTMFTDVMGYNDIFAFMPYGETWKNHRRIFQQHFSERSMPEMRDKGLEFIQKSLLPNLLDSPEHLHDHVRYLIGSIATSVTYGLPVERHSDARVRFAELTFAESTKLGDPSKYLVNIFPLLKYIPEWMPGSGFKQEAKRVKQLLLRMEEEPYRETRKMMDAGTAPGSFVMRSLERDGRDHPEHEQYAQHVKATAASVFAGTVETSVAGILTFVLTMVLNPDVQRKAQQELDTVVGHDRFPSHSDLPNLPYLSAVVKEVLRWNPIGPLGIPHMTSEEDTYDGYYIPKGCMVFANAYAMLHDETTFPSPETFDPNRFLTPDGKVRQDILDPEIVATFGFGRRICPGSKLARSILYLTFASILSLFDVSPQLDDEGKFVEFEPKFRGVDVSEPLPFPCKITPRKCKDVEGLLKEYCGTEPI